MNILIFEQTFYCFLFNSFPYFKYFKCVKCILDSKINLFITIELLL